jgi:hypothetical protein
MFWFTAPGHFLPSKAPAVEWGAFNLHIEVGDDQLAVRQVNVFRNGAILPYDRYDFRDAFGYLTGLKFSKKSKWRHFYPNAELISQSEFERIWRRALHQKTHLAAGQESGALRSIRRHDRQNDL